MLNAVQLFFSAKACGPRLSRGRLLRTYARLKMKALTTRLLPAYRPRHESLFGLRVDFFAYSTLVRLYEEIFLAQDYFFVAEEPIARIIDCGSNIGMSVLFFKSVFPDCRVTAFEPDEQTCAVLKKNVAQNGLRDVEIHQNAVGAVDGAVPFYVDPEHPGHQRMSLLRERMSKQETTVRSVRLSDYIDGRVDLLKLDVEGAEFQVLRDLAERDKLQYIRRLAVEYHHNLQSDGHSLSRFLGLLEENGFGYQLHTLSPRPFRSGEFQDVLVFAYHRNSVASK
jgi:FkbM family methyltransferase